MAHDAARISVDRFIHVASVPRRTVLPSAIRYGSDWDQYLDPPTSPFERPSARRRFGLLAREGRHAGFPRKPLVFNRAALR